MVLSALSSPSLSSCTTGFPVHRAGSLPDSFLPSSGLCFLGLLQTFPFHLMYVCMCECMCLGGKVVIESHLQNHKMKKKKGGSHKEEPVRAAG